MKPAEKAEAGPLPSRPEFVNSVVAAAHRLFVDKGYNETKMDDVAAAVRVSKPTIYESFPSKQALFEAVVNRAVLDFNTEARQILRDYDGPMDIFFIGLAKAAKVLVKQQSRDELIRLLMTEGRRMPFIVEMYWEAIYEPEIQAWTTMLSRAMERGTFRKMDPRLAARICATPAINVLVERIMFGERSMNDEMVDTYLEELFRGIIRAYVIKPEGNAPAE